MFIEDCYFRFFVFRFFIRLDEEVDDGWIGLESVYLFFGLLD